MQHACIDKRTGCIADEFSGLRNGRQTGLSPRNGHCLLDSGRTHATSAISLPRTIHRLLSMNKVLSCAVFFSSPR